MPKKILSGTVVKNTLQKTITVIVNSRFSHPRYKKIISRSKKYLVDLGNASEVPKIGATVQIIESVPISKLKKFSLLSGNN